MCTYVFKTTNILYIHKIIIYTRCIETNGEEKKRIYISKARSSSSESAQPAIQEQLNAWTPPLRCDVVVVSSYVIHYVTCTAHTPDGRINMSGKLINIARSYTRASGLILICYAHSLIIVPRVCVSACCVVYYTYKYRLIF